MHHVVTQLTRTVLPLSHFGNAGVCLLSGFYGIGISRNTESNNHKTYGEVFIDTSTHKYADPVLTFTFSS